MQLLYNDHCFSRDTNSYTDSYTDSYIDSYTDSYIDTVTVTLTGGGGGRGWCLTDDSWLCSQLRFCGFFGSAGAAGFD